MDETPAWGIEPVPTAAARARAARHRASSGGTSASRCSCSSPGRTSCRRSRCRRRSSRSSLGSLIGNAMLGLAALIGADARVPAMVLMRAPLGQRGSWAPTVLNAAQCIGWAIFELLIIATAVAALSDELLGFRAQWLWTLVFGGCRARARAARADRLRPQVRPQVRGLGRARVAALPDVVGARRLRLRRALGPRAARAASSVLEGVDLVVAITVSWIPLAADYTRFSPRSRRRLLGHRAAATSSRATWMWVLGRDPLLLTRHHRPGRAAGRGRRRRARRGAGAARRDGRRDRRGVRERRTRPPSRSRTWRRSCRSGALVTVVCVVATLGALTIDLLSYESFLLMLGSFFVPLFGVLLADWLAAGARYGERDVFAGPASAGGCSPPGSPASRSTSGCTRSGRPGGRTRSATAPAWRSARRCRASPSRSRSGSRSRRSVGAASRVRAVRGIVVIGNHRARHDRRRPAARRRRARITPPGRCGCSAAARGSSRAAPSPTVARSSRRWPRSASRSTWLRRAEHDDASSSATTARSGRCRSATRARPGRSRTRARSGGPTGSRSAALTRADFPPDVLAALARDRRLALDGQALVRRAADRPARARRRLRSCRAAASDGAEAERGGGRGARRRGARRRARRPRAAAHARLDRGAADQPRRPRAHPRPAASTPTTPPAPATPSSPATPGRARPGHRPVSAARHAATTAARVLELTARRS